jgi:hypothetical protein
MMVRSIVHDYWSQGASAHTVDMIYRKQTVFRNIPRLYIELACRLVKQQFGPAYVAGGPHTNGD